MNFIFWAVIALYFWFVWPMLYARYADWKIKRAFKRELEDDLI